jgi:hypothetical protein
MLLPLVLATLGSPAAIARAQPLTRAEHACQRALGPATDHFGAAIAACVVRCDRKTATGRLPASACVPPYGDETRACIAKANDAARKHIARGCARDCPECYGGGDCTTYGDGAVTVTGQVVDGLVSQVLCDDTGSADGLAAVEDRCRRATGAALAKAARAMGACFVRCRRGEERGALPPQACAGQPLPADARGCLERVKAATGRAIGRRCADPPECLSATLVDTLETQITGDYQLLIFCASPSGAFVDTE